MSLSPGFLQHAVGVARQAAVAAAEVIRGYYAQGVEVRIKADDSPVTRADEESEASIRAVLAEHFPDHGIYGEELGRSDKDSDFLWLIDPIDGTKAFVRRYPMFSTQIALMYRGELVLGVSSAPCYGGGELAWAATGLGAWLNEQPIRTSDISALGAAALSAGNIKSLAASPAWGGYAALCQRAYRTRGYGDFLHYHLLASGCIDLVLESDLNILDVAALAVIVREAGGVFTQLDGSGLDLGTRSVLAAATPALHAEAGAALAAWQQ